jgi:hypothetical protein
MPDAVDRPGGDLVLYETADGRTRIECRLLDRTVWLSQAQIAQLFQVTVPTVNEHLRNIFEDNELAASATLRKFRIVQREGTRDVTREVDHYNLDAILAVGYRVRSVRGVQFRQWATLRLREYLIKGFAIDDERLKDPPGPDAHGYFEELLERIRDIRSSERVFWRKVLDIYATSVDYAPSADASKTFFATVQNKMHWAAHGHTAAEIISARVDADKPFLGMTHVRPGGRVRRQDVAIAKNYLSPEELDALNRIVTAYLEFAELQARGRRAMYMADWITKLDDFLRLSERDILTHAGSISHEAAQLRADEAFDTWRALKDAEPQPVDADFDRVIKQLGKGPKQ